MWGGEMDCIFRKPLNSASLYVAVLVTGNPTTFTPHIQIECGDKKVGTLTSGEVTMTFGNPDFT
jgi:hypothetical protein